MINLLNYNIEIAASKTLEGHFPQIFYLNRGAAQLIMVLTNSKNHQLYHFYVF